MNYFKIRNVDEKPECSQSSCTYWQDVNRRMKIGTARREITEIQRHVGLVGCMSVHVCSEYYSGTAVRTSSNQDTAPETILKTPILNDNVRYTIC